MLPIRHVKSQYGGFYKKTIKSQSLGKFSDVYSMLSVDNFHMHFRVSRHMLCIYYCEYSILCHSQPFTTYPAFRDYMCPDSFTTLEYHGHSGCRYYPKVMRVKYKWDVVLLFKFTEMRIKISYYLNLYENSC